MGLLLKNIFFEPKYLCLKVTQLVTELESLETISLHYQGNAGLISQIVYMR